MNSRDVIKALKKDGWYEVNQAGNYKQSMPPKKAASRCRIQNGTSRWEPSKALKNRPGSS
jgi:hypothetical protein